MEPVIARRRKFKDTREKVSCVKDENGRDKNEPKRLWTVEK